MLHTPLARERCRAQAVLWLAEGLPAEQIADTFQVSRQTVYNWAERFRRREGLDLRARLLDAPRSGRPPLISGIIDPLIEAAFAHHPRELGYQSTVWTAELLVHYLGQAHGIEASRKSVSLAITPPPSPLETAPTSVGVAAGNFAHRAKRGLLSFR